MKKLLYVVLVFFVARESFAKELYWNLRRFVPAEKVTKRCDQEPRAWLWFQKSEVEKVCDCLDADLNIIREAYEVANVSGVRLLNMNVERINNFLAEAESKMLKQGVVTAINTILPNESSEVCEEESQKFIAARHDAIDQFFQAGEPDQKAKSAKNRTVAMRKYERANTIERTAQTLVGARLLEDVDLRHILRSKGWQEENIICLFQRSV